MRTNLERALNGREIAALALVGPGGSIAERDFEAALDAALTHRRSGWIMVSAGDH